MYNTIFRDLFVKCSLHNYEEISVGASHKIPVYNIENRNMLKKYECIYKELCGFT